MVFQNLFVVYNFDQLDLHLIQDIHRGIKNHIHLA